VIIAPPAVTAFILQRIAAGEPHFSVVAALTGTYGIKATTAHKLANQVARQAVVAARTA
jgi:hypothetical protein